MEDNNLEEVKRCLEIYEAEAATMSSKDLLVAIRDKEFLVKTQQVLQNVFVLMNVHRELTGHYPELPNILRICTLLIAAPAVGQPKNVAPNMPAPKGTC